MSKAVRELPTVELPVSVGEDLATTMINTVEADMALAIHRRAMAAAQTRLRVLNADFRRMIDELNTNYSETEEGLVRMYIIGCRDELLKCYMAVQPETARTPDGRKTVIELVDQVIASTVNEIKKPEGAEKRPIKSSSSSARRAANP